MRVLIIRHDTDGVTWQTHALDAEWEYADFLSVVRAHLNTIGVTRLEIIPEGEPSR